ncbi:hypothetical protein L596_026318 [Steinernema carpocapsae]|uniref:Protein kinase domain-containing protein n=2 Tax=Steinernema carpocapsae TaxID=34508 RepID=A0A4U5M0Z3_STECR|nr:hypothetical protein L596_026318 [Steinernema carpocapsae]
MSSNFVNVEHWLLESVQFNARAKTFKIGKTRSQRGSDRSTKLNRCRTGTSSKMSFRQRRGSESDLSFPGINFKKKSSVLDKNEKTEKKRKKSYAGRASLPCKRKWARGSKPSMEEMNDILFSQEHTETNSLYIPNNSPRLPISPSTNSVPDYRCLSKVSERPSNQRVFWSLMATPQSAVVSSPEHRREDPEKKRPREFVEAAKRALNETKQRKNKRIETLEVERCEMRGETKAYIKVDDVKKAKMGDVLWVQLQAFLAGRYMGDESCQRKSINDHDEYILKERKRLQGVLKDICDFRFDMGELYATAFNDRNTWFQTLSNDCYMEHVRNARKSVNCLLTRFFEYWELFPRFKAIFPKAEGQRDVSAEDKETMYKLDLLLVWYNNFDFLRDLMKNIGNILLHRSSSAAPVSNRSSRSSADTFHFWPKDEGHSPSQSWAKVYHNEIHEDMDDGLSKSPELDEMNAEMENQEGYHKFLLERFKTLYREVVQQSLQLRGMREVLNEIAFVSNRILEKAAKSLIMKRSYAHVASDSNLLSQSFHQEHSKHTDEVTLNSEHFTFMNLPSFYPFFQFLVTIPVDLVEQWCIAKSTRSENRASKRDLLTINTLIEECHECLNAALAVKDQYVTFVKMTCLDPMHHFEYLKSFDKELVEIFLKYFDYLHEWADSGSDFSSSDMEWSAATQTVDKLIAEWRLTKAWTVSIPSAESDAARNFCHISKKVLKDLVLSFLRSEVEDIERMGVQDEDQEEAQEEVNDSFEVIDESTTERKHSAHSVVFMQCRRINRLIQNLRYRSLKALAFLKAISNDLEFCAKYKVKLDAEITGEYLVGKLLKAGFVMLKFKDCESLPFYAMCPVQMGNNSDLINSLLNCICSRCSKLTPQNSKQESMSKEQGSLDNEGSMDGFGSTMESFSRMHISKNHPNFLVVLSKSLFNADDYNPNTDSPYYVNIQDLRDVHIRHSTGVNLSSYITVQENEVYIISETRCAIKGCCKVFESVFSASPDRMELSHDFCSLYDYLEVRLDESREKVVEICNYVWSYVKEINSAVGANISHEKDNEIRLLRDTLLRAYCLAFEITKEVLRLIPASGGAQFAQHFVSYVKQWEAFLKDMIEKQQPISTTLWGDEAFNCILTGYSKYSKFLSADKVDVSYSIKNLLEINRQASMRKAQVWSGHNRHPSRSTSTNENMATFAASDKKPLKPAERILLECEGIDKKIESRLYRMGQIGRETQCRREPSRYFKSERKAPFKWQCLEKCLGRGQQGSVHVVYDTDNTRCLAMKQIQIQYNDEEQLTRVVTEVENLRKLDHINLVKYYGVEIKNECMMIFMEYCNHGTLDRMCRGERLDLMYVRRYTHQLLSAVEYIHSQNIVHRDIKPANIFLTDMDILKLGDFGCSFRLASGSTIIGEIQEHIGTACYMAPEIATRGGEIPSSETADHVIPVYHGYGRAVDIWSTGCVVLEMLTGKRPYHHLKSDFQIYYAHGTGKHPEIPPGLNDLTLNFLNRCLVVDPIKRATAHDLLADDFANIQLAE